MSLRAPPSKFEFSVLEHLDAGYNLARWLTRNDQDAQDVVQESCMKALRAADSYRGGDLRIWFLAIVRNTCFSLLSRNKTTQALETDNEIVAESTSYDPQAIAMRAADTEAVRQAIDALPDTLRETIILREIEGLSYKEIGKIIGLPIGTVMSRLSRGRSQLQSLLMKVGQP